MEIPVENCPWFHPDNGWMVAALPIAWWGLALEDRPVLPGRWLLGADGPGEVEPSDLEQTCYVHLIEHERARLSGSELAMLADCGDLADGVPAAAAQAAEAGHSVVAWCPGVSWFWPEENVPGDKAGRFASR